MRPPYHLKPVFACPLLFCDKKFLQVGLSCSNFTGSRTMRQSWEGSRATWKAASGLTSQEFAKWRGRSRLHGVGFWCTDLNRHAKLRLFAVSSASTRLPTEVRIEGKQNRAPTF